MKYLIPICFLSCLLTSSNAKAQDHLEPVESIFNVYDFQFEYYPKVRALLFKDLNDSPNARFLILPSFSGETSVDIVNTGDKYIIEYRKAVPSIWYSLSDDKMQVSIESITKEINQEDAELIIEVFTKFLQQVRYPETKRLGMDGSNYYFFANQKSGTIWSPKVTSKTGRLTEIGTDLLAFCSSNEKRFDEDYKERIRQLIAAL